MQSQDGGDVDPREDQEWNMLAEEMNRYHSGFKASYARLVDQNDRVKGRGDLLRMVNDSLSFVRHLHTHHSIEEAYIFPNLARWDPLFAPDGQHIADHVEMTKGLDEFAQYAKVCAEDASQYNPTRYREHMNLFAQTLFRHLDEEVASLAGTRLRKTGMTLRDRESTPLAFSRLHPPHEPQTFPPVCVSCPPSPTAPEQVRPEGACPEEP